MTRRGQSDLAKLAIAARSRWETTLRLKAIAARFHPGSHKSVNAWLWELRAAQKAERKAAFSHQDSEWNNSR